MAATRLEYVKSGTMVRDAYPDHYDKSMDTFLERSSNTPMVNTQFFTEEAATTLEHKLTTWGKVLEIPYESEDTAPVQYDQPAPGYDLTMALKTYRNAIHITETLEKIDISGKIDSMMMGLPESGKKFIEYITSNVINTGASTAGSDGSNLFATDHFNERLTSGLNSTWSNLETAADLTTSSFNTAAVNMANRKDEGGDPMPIMPVKLMVAPAGREKALQIAGSEGVPEDALNSINVYKGSFDVVVNPWLTDSDAWYVWGDLPRDMWGLHIAYLTKPEIKGLDFPNAQYPYISKGWTLKIQMDAAGAQLKNMVLNQGA